jgi:phosphatidylinositol-bisphosphatase
MKFQALHPKAKYKNVRQIRLVGMMIIVFVKECLKDYVSEVVAETVGTGLMGELIAINISTV